MTKAQELSAALEEELAKEKETNETALNELYEKWEQLSE